MFGLVVESIGGIIRVSGQQDAVIPGVTQLSAKRKATIDDEHRVRGPGDPARFNLSVAIWVECAHHEAGASRHSEWFEKHTTQHRVVETKAVVTRRSVCTKSVLRIAGTVEILEGCPKHRASALGKNRGQIVTKHRLSALQRPIDGNNHTARTVNGGDLGGECAQIVDARSGDQVHVMSLRLITVTTVSSTAPDAGRREAIARSVSEWYRSEARDLPWRRPGFTAWGTLVSEFMLQQTPVNRVIPHLERWLERWPTPAALAAEPPSEAVRAWASLGYPRRALWLHSAAVEIVERHAGVVPGAVDALLQLSGVGDYTARAVAVFAYGDRHPVVDTNTRRVIARAITGHGEPAPPSRARDLAAMEALLPTDVADSAILNAAMMELGAVVCVARTPRCDACPVRNECAWRASGYPEYAGPKKAVQKKFEGSDRQVRGLIMRELRATHRPLEPDEIVVLWPDATQRDRALKGLLADGLAVASQGGYLLPGGAES